MLRVYHSNRLAAELMLVHRWDLGVQVFHVSQGRVSFDVTLLYPSLYFCL